MGFPNKDKLKAIRTRLEKAEPSRTLPKDASTVEIIKSRICEKISSIY